jgi:V-type H+-transporting ATPase subunit a
MIHTIEFVLGTVSNTASYLRLWALSLAHGQLTEVFFNLSFAQFLNMFAFSSLGVTIPAFLVAWPIFWSCIFFVIMLMDTLECALHTLRLHWVEF